MKRSRDIFGASDAYDGFMGRWSRRLAPMLAAFAEVGARQAILEVGCGTGSLALSIVDAVRPVRVTAVDPSIPFVTAARAQSAAGGVGFAAARAGALPFGSALFDRTLSLLVINFVPEPAGALREMRRVTRPGGLVAAAVWDYGGGMEMLRAFWDEAASLDPSIASRDEKHMPLCRAGELSALWREAGLRDVVEAPLVIEMTFDGFDDYWQPFLGGQGPAGGYAVSLGAAARASLETALRRRLLGDSPDTGFVLPAQAWAVRGTVGAA